MKHLVLLRHAAAERESPGLKDFDRPLSDRGLQEAPEAARRFATAAPIPDLLLSSPARRALETARIFARVLKYPLRRLATDKRLYLAVAPELLAVVRDTDNSIERLMLVGHNPGLTDFA